MTHLPAVPTTLREKAAQLVFARLGSNMPPPVTVAEDADRVAALLDRCPLGGLVLFNGSLAETPTTLERLQAAAPFPLLIGTDMERGVGQQVRGATVFPHAMAFAALEAGAEAAVEASARAAAREALACGIHLAFCPVADVNRERRNPIIATRAFGETPEAVARLVRAYIRGCRAEGLLTTAKHFPGHGATRQDTHAELPTVDDPRAVLDQTDLLPFRAALSAGVELVMTGHIVFPALDPQGRPATVSPPILQDLLRDELGFGGAVITDSLLMGAIRAAPGEEGAQAAALVAAGIDIVLDTPDPEAAVAGLVEAVEAGRLSEARLDDACRRVWALKTQLQARFGGSIFQHFDPEGAVRPEHATLAENIARRAVAVEDDAGLLPLGGGAETLVLLVKPYRSRLDAPEEPLGAAVRAVLPGARYHEIGPEADAAALASWAAEAEAARHLVVALIVKPSAWHVLGLKPAQQRFVEALVARRRLVLASLGTPYVFDAFAAPAARVCTFSDVGASQRALAAVLAGR